MAWQFMVPENWALRNKREKLGFTQEEVAKKADITLEQYQRYEKNGVNISSSSMRIVNAVLTALELDLTSFAKGEYSLEPLTEDNPLNPLKANF